MAMKLIFMLLIIFVFACNVSKADNHVYLELDCSTEFGDGSVLILKQVPIDDGPWVEDLPFTSAGLFMGKFYLAEVKENKINMKVYYDADVKKSFDTEDTLQEMVIIDRYAGTLSSIYFNDDGSIYRPLSFTGECKKKVLKKKQF